METSLCREIEKNEKKKIRFIQPGVLRRDQVAFLLYFSLLFSTKNSIEGTVEVKGFGSNLRKKKTENKCNELSLIGTSLFKCTKRFEGSLSILLVMPTISE
jgi:hypothetical protein